MTPHKNKKIIFQGSQNHFFWINHKSTKMKARCFYSMVLLA